MHILHPAQVPLIQVRADGSITGIDGMLDQISASVGRQILPMLRDQVLPVLQNDRQLQMTVGRAAGQQIAKPLWALAIVTGTYLGWKIYTNNKKKT